MYESWNDDHKIRLVKSYRLQNVVCLFCALNITQDIENLIQTSLKV